MLPLTLAMGMCFGHLYCMLLLAEAVTFLFTLYLFPLNRGPSVEIFRILVSSQTVSVFPEAPLRCGGPGFSLHLQAVLHVFRNQDLWMIQVKCSLW